MFYLKPLSLWALLIVLFVSSSGVPSLSWGGPRVTRRIEPEPACAQESRSERARSERADRIDDWVRGLSWSLPVADRMRIESRLDTLWVRGMEQDFRAVERLRILPDLHPGEGLLSELALRDVISVLDHLDRSSSQGWLAAWVGEFESGLPQKKVEALLRLELLDFAMRQDRALEMEKAWEQIGKEPLAGGPMIQAFREAWLEACRSEEGSGSALRFSLRHPVLLTSGGPLFLRGYQEALAAGRPELIRFFIERGGGLEAHAPMGSPHEGMTPLMVAVRQNDAVQVSFLLGKGASVLTQDSQGRTVGAYLSGASFEIRRAIALAEGRRWAVTLERSQLIWELIQALRLLLP